MTSLAYQGLGPAAVVHDEAESHDGPGLLVRIDQLLCGWRRGGHEMMLHTDRRRLYLVCRRCLRETPGWSVEKH